MSDVKKPKNKKKANQEKKPLSAGRVIFYIVIVAAVALLTVSIVSSFSNGHIFSKSVAPDELIPSDTEYYTYLQERMAVNIGKPEENWDPVDTENLSNSIVLPTLKSAVTVEGVKGTISSDAEKFGITTVTLSDGSQKDVMVTDETGTVTYELTVSETGFYRLYVTYMPLAEGDYVLTQNGTQNTVSITDGGSNIERAVYVKTAQQISNEVVTYGHELDNLGTIPYDEISDIKFYRYWTNETDIYQDVNGNDMKPSQIEIFKERTVYIQDNSGYVTDPYLIYLTKGTNKVSFESIRETMAILEVGLTSATATKTLNQEGVAVTDTSMKSYEEYKAYYDNQGAEVVDSTYVQQFEVELPTETSSPTLYAISDRTDPINTPSDPVRTKLNSIGGTKWETEGDFITWTITAPSAGYYMISFRAKQDATRGLFSSRRVYINGKVPFLEANSTRFFYDTSWSIVTLGTETEGYYFYLNEGENTITLQAVYGEYGTSITEVQAIIDELNELYLRIIAVTTTNPDPYQNYYLTGENARVVGVLDTFEDASERLKVVVERINNLSGEMASTTASLRTMYVLLDKLIKKPLSIPSNLTQYASDLSSLGTWITTVKAQALTLEAGFISGSTEALPNANSSWINSLVFNTKAFFESFFFDYEAIGTTVETESEDAIDVWFMTSETTGRDQANILRTLIDKYFVDEDGYPLRTVNLKLVSPSVLLPSTLAGTGPDIAINIDSGTPINYALRGAVQTVSTLQGLTDEEQAEHIKDFNEVKSWFQDSSMVPFYYDSTDDGVDNGDYYALPYTASFLVMFYRTDVFEKYGWSVPETWEDVTNLVRELQIKNMQFYLPVNGAGANAVNSIFATMLYQKGGSFYKDNGEASNFDSEEGLEAFEEWCKYYTDYGFPLSASFSNRFRTGETPIGISDYTLYNTFAVFAPEIAGKWAFNVIPGTYDSEGNLDISGVAGGSCLILMRGAEDVQGCWEFMKWFVSADVQAQYAREMESILGSAGRHSTANIEAFKTIGWTRSELEVLMEQWNNTVGVPQVPGGYYTGRNLENAFRQVVNNDTNPRETLLEYVETINEELTRKRKEFGLSTSEDDD